MANHPEKEIARSSTGLSVEDFLSTEYSIPERNDLLVVMAFFSPCGYRKPLMHLETVRRKMRRAGIPLLTIAAEYDHNKEGDLPDTDVRIKGRYAMCHKENLWNIAFRKSDPHYNKFCFIDADILFSDPEWYDHLSILLDRNDFVQPMDNCIWQGEDPDSIEGEKQSATRVMEEQGVVSHTKGHVGFAVATTRKFMDETEGFHDLAFLGSGDSILMEIIAESTGISIPSDFTRSGKRNIRDVDNGLLDRKKELVRKFAPKVGTLYGNEVLHLYHGSLKNRKYENRSYMFTGEKDSITRTPDGLTQPGSEDMASRILRYYKTRSEDGGDNSEWDGSVSSVFEKFVVGGLMGKSPVTGSYRRRMSILASRWNDGQWIRDNIDMIVSWGCEEIEKEGLPLDRMDMDAFKESLLG